MNAVELRPARLEKAIFVRTHLHTSPIVVNLVKIYNGQTLACGYVNIPNIVYKSQDVGTPYFSTITNLVIEMTLWHVVALTLPLGQVVTILCGTDSSHLWGESCRL